MGVWWRGASVGQLAVPGLSEGTVTLSSPPGRAAGDGGPCVCLPCPREAPLAPWHEEIRAL